MWKQRSACQSVLKMKRNSSWPGREVQTDVESDFLQGSSLILGPWGPSETLRPCPASEQGLCGPPRTCLALTCLLSLAASQPLGSGPTASLAPLPPLPCRERPLPRSHWEQSGDREGDVPVAAEQSLPFRRRASLAPEACQEKESHAAPKPVQAPLSPLLIWIPVIFNSPFHPWPSFF